MEFTIDAGGGLWYHKRIAMVEIVQYFYVVVHYEADLYSNLMPYFQFPDPGTGREKGLYSKRGSDP
jgi:hypothetical protein